MIPLSSRQPWERSPSGPLAALGVTKRSRFGEVSE